MAGPDRRETIQARRHRLSVIPRACEGCKIRKVRCDRSVPCSNCQASGITCEQANPVRRSEARPRPERDLQAQIICLEERLVSLEQQLKTQGYVSEHRRKTIPDEAPAASEEAALQLTGTAPVYEGISSFTGQSILASDVAQKTANSEGAGEHSDLKSSLAYLKTLLQTPTRSSLTTEYRMSRAAAARSLPTMDHLLPIDLIIAVLQEIKLRRPIFLCSYAVNDRALVERLCQRVYFPTESISTGHLAAMHGIILTLLKEFTILRNPLCQKFDLKAHTSICEENFNTLVESYDVLAIPSFESIFALIMGFIKAQDEAKPLLCCTFIAAAASHCQMLGYHREIMYRSDNTGTSENMRRIFWTTYVFEKHMSLYFGRASSMQDFDIDAQYPAVSTDLAVKPWDESFVMGIRLAKIQGEIYDRLYSAEASKISHPERMRRVHGLAVDIQDWYTEFKEIDASKVNNPHIFKITRDSWDILYYSTFTSLLRAPIISGAACAEISSQCFRVARLSLQSHLRCFGSFQTSSFHSKADYANWVLLFSSFTPFIVIFLHAIAATSMDDIRLLDEIVESLQHIRYVSPSSDRLYQICSTFLQIAKGLVETRQSCVGTYNQQEDSLQFVTDSGPMSIFEPDCLHGLFGEDTSEYAPYLADHDLSAIFDSWATGLPAGINLFSKLGGI
ncbi:hypothetical protein BDV26DRAFT_264430 [Aspergillus bertholletiae]|uniref:Zn(2)-C6 fungal-type domain-containing protein n=1 Tax=Aspergillus bertholletiae TaxID=1226010 RepID=A0A5N7B4S8_9EURO|nr:hypothetical protein BDV26DRAFT_264430 [Aspergillus bertholletiae]